MTVEQLIKKLQALPHQDAEILLIDEYNCLEICRSISEPICRKDLEMSDEDEHYDDKYILETTTANNFYLISHYHENLLEL